MSNTPPIANATFLRRAGSAGCGGAPKLGISAREPVRPGSVGESGIGSVRGFSGSERCCGRWSGQLDATFGTPNPIGAVVPIGASPGPDKPGFEVGAGGTGGPRTTGAVGRSAETLDVLGVSKGDKPKVGPSVGTYDGALGRGGGTTFDQGGDAPSGKGVVVGFGAVDGVGAVDAVDAAAGGGKGFPATTATNALCIS